MKKQSILLQGLRVKNFKGITNLEIEAARNTRVEGENGKGKTTILDAFLWLLFDKDSTGRTEFGIRPLDSKNQPIKGLVCMVEAVLNINGSRCVLKKEHHEKIVKDQLRGYTTLCWVDDVPKKAGQYAEYISGIIPEDSFRLLTNLRHFNENLSWKDRRAVLLDIAGEIGTPAGFDELLSALNGRSLDDYKKVLAGQLHCRRRAQDRADHVHVWRWSRRTCLHHQRGPWPVVGHDSQAAGPAGEIAGSRGVYLHDHGQRPEEPFRGPDRRRPLAEPVHCHRTDGRGHDRPVRQAMQRDRPG